MMTQFTAAIQPTINCVNKDDPIHYRKYASPGPSDQ